jgi:hypothetical protein
VAALTSAAPEPCNSTAPFLRTVPRSRMPHGMPGRQSSAGRDGTTAGGVKILGFPLSAGGRTVGALHKSTALPDWPATAGTVAMIAAASAADTDRICRAPTN